MRGKIRVIFKTRQLFGLYRILYLGLEVLSAFTRQVDVQCRVLHPKRLTALKTLDLGTLVVCPCGCIVGLGGCSCGRWPVEVR